MRRTETTKTTVTERKRDAKAAERTRQGRERKKETRGRNDDGDASMFSAETDSGPMGGPENEKEETDTARRRHPTTRSSAPAEASRVSRRARARLPGASNPGAVMLEESAAATFRRRWSARPEERGASQTHRVAALLANGSRASRSTSAEADVRPTRTLRNVSVLEVSS